ncbi:MAG: hypothetical protein ACD_62C00075G0003 [uncultured bacterium]|nr:MAG: hypothetical protein ACD_62C00075G0003 [uncultured bacterium]
MKTVLLMGNPNVGKSALFSRLTGTQVVISNYPGTSVEYTQGALKHETEEATIIDVPGTYTMQPTCRAEQVAVAMLPQADVLINVVDATNLERNLNLTLQLLEKKIPLVVALNMWDEAQHQGIKISVPALEQELGLPVIPTCSLTGEGIHSLVHRLPEAKQKPLGKLSDAQRWQRVGDIVKNVQVLSHKHHSLAEKLQDLSITPWTGALVTLIVLAVAFGAIRFMGEGLMGWVFEPFFRQLWMPLMQELSRLMNPESLLHHLLIGQLTDGTINPFTAFGVLTTGLFIAFAMIFPYIVSFYFVLGLLEDWGYLPRLATLMDSVMHRLGLHGYAIIPMLLGMGCNVPGIMATRILESRRERFITATLMSIAIPCLAQTAMMVALLGQRGLRYVMFIFAVLFLVWLILGRLLHRFMKGASPELIIEIPPYRVPQLRFVIKKLWMRARAFVFEAVPYMLGGILFVSVLRYFDAAEGLNRLLAPVFTHIWGLPAETVPAILIGILKKEIAVAMLAPLGLTTKQLIIACTILALYFPCVATFFVLLKELGVKDLLKTLSLMIFISLLVGGSMNWLLPNF